MRSRAQTNKPIHRATAVFATGPLELCGFVVLRMSEMQGTRESGLATVVAQWPADLSRASGLHTDRPFCCAFSSVLTEAQSLAGICKNPRIMSGGFCSAQTTILMSLRVGV